MRVWLDDDDPGLARTMAALDKRLRRAERAVIRLDRLERCIVAAAPRPTAAERRAGRTRKATSPKAIRREARDAAARRSRSTIS